MNTVDFLNLLVAAVLLAGVYAAMSVGMTIIYGVLKIVNLAHAGFLMLGAYFVYELYTRLGVDPLLGVIEQEVVESSAELLEPGRIVGEFRSRRPREHALAQPGQFRQCR